MSEAPSVWPLGLYAPGKYICKCAICEKQFDGDKRAVQCLECAVRHLRISAEAAECKVVELEEERDEARISLGEAEHHLSNLLARIHRDGGHYEADHGAVKAAEDADKIVANLYAAEADKARLSEALRKGREIAVDVMKALMATGSRDNLLLADAVHKADDVARAALSGSGSGWREMDSAPKDGTRFLAYVKDGEVDFFHWQNLDHANAPIGWRDSFIQVYREADPNGPQGWMPLPAAPQQGGE